MAASVPISVAATSLSKLLVLLTGAAAVAVAALSGARLSELKSMWTPRVVLLMLAALTLSLTYTSAPWDAAITDIGKYAKLLVIVLIPVLIRSAREARIAVSVCVASMVFVMLSSWLLAMGITPPWVIKAWRSSQATVFSSYLDQSLMTVGLAAMCWHLRLRFPGRKGPWLAIALAMLATVNVLFLLPGRTGHLAMIAVISLGLFWALPRAMRLWAVLAPVVLLALAMLASPQLGERFALIITETRAYQASDDRASSSAERLNFWQRSVQAIAERPLTGFGVGSWNREFQRLEGGSPPERVAHVRNPHQEFLLWGVQLGLGGIALLVALLGTLVKDAAHFAPPARHAAKSLVAVTAVACLFNSALFDAFIGDYFCLALGLLLAYGLQTSNPPAQPAAAQG